MYVDPFYGGQVLYRDDVCRRIAATTGRQLFDPSLWLEPASHRQWLSRMLNNLQATFAQTGRGARSVRDARIKRVADELGRAAVRLSNASNAAKPRVPLLAALV